jgi:hypothetical protein
VDLTRAGGVGGVGEPIIFVEWEEGGSELQRRQLLLNFVFTERFKQLIRAFCFHLDYI